MARSIYDRMRELESYIPQLDAAQTENAQELLRMIGAIVVAHNELVRRISKAAGVDFSDLEIDAFEAPKPGVSYVNDRE